MGYETKIVVLRCNEEFTIAQGDVDHDLEVGAETKQCTIEVP